MAVTVAEAFVTLRPDLSKFSSEAEGKLGSLGGLASLGVKAFAAVGVAAAAAGGLLIKEAAAEEQGMIQLAQAARQAGVDWEAQGKDIEKTVTQWQRMSSVADDEIRPAFALMIAQTGDINKAIERMPLALDVARGANIDLATSARLLGKLNEENVAVFTRMGVVVKKGATEAEVLAAVQQKFGGQAAAFAETAAGGWAEVQNEFNDILETLGFALLPLFKEATKAILGMMRAFSEGGGLQAFVTNMGKVLGSLGEMIGVLTGLTPEAGGVLRTLIGDKEAEAVMQALAAIREAFKALMSVVGPVLGFIAEHFDVIAAVVLPFLVVALATAVKAFLAAKIAALAFAITTGTALLPVLIPLAAIGLALFLLWKNWDKVTGFIQGAADGLAKFLGNVADGIGTAFKNVGDFFAHFGDNVGNAFRGVGDAIGQALGNLGTFFGNLFKPVGDFVANVQRIWSGLWSQFSANPARAIGFLVGFFIGGFLKIRQTIDEFAAKAIGAFFKWVGDSKTAIGNFLGSLPGQVAAWLGQTAGSIGDFKTTAGNAIGTWVANSWTAISGFFTALPGNIANWLGQTAANIVAFAGNAAAAFGTWVGDVWRTISSFFTSLPGRMWSFAVQAVQGLIGGFGSMVTNVKDAIGNFFGGVVDGVKAALGIHSPSRVFADIGENMMRGLAQGITDNRDQPRSALRMGLLDAASVDLRAPSRAGAGGSALGPVNITVGPLTLNYSGPEEPAKVRRMGADTLDYITQGLTDQFNRLAVV